MQEQYLGLEKVSCLEVSSVQESSASPCIYSVGYHSGSHTIHTE